jgi:hypothetical protein
MPAQELRKRQKARGPSRGPTSIMDHGGMDLAARLCACTRRRHLQSGDRLSGGFRSEVVGCTTASGEEVVVKPPLAC